MDYTKNISPMRVAIIDDEPIAREILENHIKGINALKVVATCKNGIEASMKSIQRKSI